MDLHEIANLFPGMTGTDYGNLKRSIELSGQQETIKVWNGAVIDGRHRLKACQELGIEPRFETFEGAEAEAVSYVLALNLHRRQLSDSQRGMIASKVATYRRENNLLQSPKVQNVPSVATQENQQLSGITQAQAADLLNVSLKSVKRAAVVRNHGVDEVVEAAEQGAVSVVAAEQIAHFDKETQREVLKDIVAGKPIGETIAAAKEKAAPKEFKKFSKTSVAPKPREPAKVQLRALKNQWEDAFRAVRLAWELTQHGDGVTAEWQNVANSINSILDIVDKAGEFAFNKINPVEEPEPPDEPEPAYDVYTHTIGENDEPDALFDDAPNPYEWD